MISKQAKEALITERVMDKAKEQVKEEVTHERLEKMGDRLNFWEKIEATIKLWS